MGSTNENEVQLHELLISAQTRVLRFSLQLMLNAVLTCLFDSLSTMLRKNVEKRHLYENLDLVMLTLDEICDDG
jgi:hypothetical protein